MSIAQRKGRARAEREQRIVAAARRIAEGEGWAAVTVRRLAEEIEHSQPVLYSHFASRDAIVAAVAVEGFRELADLLRRATRDARGPGAAAAADGYLRFAREHPAVYDAMFTLPTGLRFAQPDTPPEPRDAFAALAAAVAQASPASADTDLATETFWAALHGLAALERSGRIREGARAQRLALVVRALRDR